MKNLVILNAILLMELNIMNLWKSLERMRQRSVNGAIRSEEGLLT